MSHSLLIGSRQSSEIVTFAAVISSFPWAVYIILLSPFMGLLIQFLHFLRPIQTVGAPFPRRPAHGGAAL